MRWFWIEKETKWLTLQMKYEWGNEHIWNFDNLRYHQDSRGRFSRSFSEVQHFDIVWMLFCFIFICLEKWSVRTVPEILRDSWDHSRLWTPCSLFRHRGKAGRISCNSQDFVYCSFCHKCIFRGCFSYRQVKRASRWNPENGKDWRWDGCGGIFVFFARAGDRSRAGMKLLTPERSEEWKVKSEKWRVKKKWKVKSEKWKDLC